MPRRPLFAKKRKSNPESLLPAIIVGGTGDVVEINSSPIIQTRTLGTDASNSLPQLDSKKETLILKKT